MRKNKKTVGISAKQTGKKVGGMTTVKQLMPYLGRRRLSLLLTLLLAAASVVLQLYVPVLFGSAIDALSGGVDHAAMGRSLLLAAALAAGSGVCTFLMNLLNNNITFRVVEELRSDAIRHLQKTPLSYLDLHSTGDMLSRVTSDVDILSDGLLLGFTQLFSGVITIIVTLVFMFSRNILVSLIVVLLTPLSFLVARFVSSRSYRLFCRQSEIRGRQTALIDESVVGQKVIRAFGYEERAQRSFDELNDELTECSTQAVFYSSLTNPSTRFVNNLVYAGVALADGVELIVNILVGNALILALCFETLVLAESDLGVKGNFKSVGSGAVIGHVHIDDGRSADHAQLGFIKAELESLGGELVHSVLIEDLCAVHALNDSARSLALAEAGNIY